MDLDKKVERPLAARWGESPQTPPVDLRHENINGIVFKRPRLHQGQAGTLILRDLTARAAVAPQRRLKHDTRCPQTGDGGHDREGSQPPQLAG